MWTRLRGVEWISSVTLKALRLHAVAMQASGMKKVPAGGGEVRNSKFQGQRNFPLFGWFASQKREEISCPIEKRAFVSGPMPSGRRRVALMVTMRIIGFKRNRNWETMNH